MAKLTYKSAGVNIEMADSFLGKAKTSIKSTFTPGVITDIGHFGAFFKPDLGNYKDPVIIASTDGVGTKLKVAQMSQKHETIGQDLVNHCVNDILCAGATPLFFMDYLAMGKLDENIAVDVVKGLCIAAKENNTAVIGGETAEMPGLYQGEDYDLAGTIVGIVDRSRVIDGSNIQKGDVMIGLPSNGLHTNGYSLARKICFDIKGFSVDTFIEELGCTIGEELLKIHRSYLHTIKRLIDLFEIKGLSHITGGGIVGNTIRIVPKGLQLHIDWSAWEILPIFQLLKEWGELSDEEMRLTFNLGIGMIIIVDNAVEQDIIDSLKQLGENPVKLGEII